MGVVLTGGPGCPGTALMVMAESTSEYKKYLFNCGEGFSRHADMSKGSGIKLANLRNIFITHKRWENIAGLVGCAMTLQESSKQRNEVKKQPSSSKSLILSGPPGIENIPTMAKKVNDGQHLSVWRCKQEFTDGSFTISPVVFYDDKPRACATRLQDSSESSDMSDDPPELDCAYAYICKVKPMLNKILKHKCKALGVRGRQIGQLKHGDSVTLQDGRVITPDMVTEKQNKDNRPFLVVECPTLSFLPSLSTNPVLAEYLTPDVDKSFMIVVHMTPDDVFRTDEYQAWMARFHKSTHHMVLNKSSAEMDPARIRNHQSLLQLVDAEIFPNLNFNLTAEGDDLVKSVVASNENEKTAGVNQSDEVSGKDGSVTPVQGHQCAEAVTPGQGQVVRGRPGLMFNYRSNSNLGFQQHKEAHFYRLETCKKRPEVVEALANLRTSLNALEEEEKSVGEKDVKSYPKLVFLGTASAETNRLRCQSCILVELNEASSMILDCGEDSYGQVYRFYGREKVAEALTKVKAIFVSHMHIDHFLGLFTLLMERKKAFEVVGKNYELVIIAAPLQFRRWLYVYEEEMEPITHLFKWLQHQSGWEITDNIATENITGEHMKSHLQLLEYKPVEVIHCRNAYGVTFTTDNGTKVTYSGDTTPCEELIEAGKNSDILIHEATHEDSLDELAKAAKHSTFSEAISVGKRMCAKHVILTHFSQRYSHMVPMDNLDLPPNLGIAFDNMMVTPTTITRLPKLIPALIAIFTDELEELRKIHKRRLEKKDETNKQNGEQNEDGEKGKVSKGRLEKNEEDNDKHSDKQNEDGEMRGVNKGRLEKNEEDNDKQNEDGEKGGVSKGRLEKNEEDNDKQNEDGEKGGMNKRRLEKNEDENDDGERGDMNTNKKPKH